MPDHWLFHDARVLRWGFRAAVTVLVAGLLAFVVQGANTVERPTLGPPTTAPVAEEPAD